MEERQSRKSSKVPNLCTNSHLQCLEKIFNPWGLFFNIEIKMDFSSQFSGRLGQLSLNKLPVFSTIRQQKRMNIVLERYYIGTMNVCEKICTNLLLNMEIWMSENC